MRKMKGFYIASAGLLVVALCAFWYGADATKVFESYALFQGITTAGFFGGNVGEHMAKAKAAIANGNDKQG